MIKFFIVLIFLVIIGIFAVAGYNFISNFTYTRHITLPPQLLASSSTDATSSGDGLILNTPADVFGQTDPSALNPASSTIDTTSWHMYVNNSLGFTIQYPKGMLVNPDIPDSFVMVVPKDQYFHWPLLDDVKITVSASSTCPQIASGAIFPEATTTVANGYTFTRSEGSDVGAGNIYREMAFDVTKDNICYHIDMLDHGTNGAGFYVSDQDLITRYNNQHQSDLNAVVAIFITMVDSFRLISPK
jgi:hypothetical protein